MLDGGGRAFQELFLASLLISSNVLEKRRWNSPRNNSTEIGRIFPAKLVFPTVPFCSPSVIGGDNENEVFFPGASGDVPLITWTLRSFVMWPFVN